MRGRMRGRDLASMQVLIMSPWTSAAQCESGLTGSIYRHHSGMSNHSLLNQQTRSRVIGSVEESFCSFGEIGNLFRCPWLILSLFLVNPFAILG